ncbi:MAG: hypothetical protein HRU28_03565 [Rhizobiales bacterium]|nr:hypothetical protein [Hyphomicrobiales bacterium]
MTQKELNVFPKVEPHGNIEQIINNVWYVTGSVVLKPLIRLIRNMIIVRNEDGELTLINSVRLDEAGEKALDALGKVTHIMKIGGHGMDDAYYLNRYNATHWAVGSGAKDAQNEGSVALVEGIELPFADAQLFEFRDTVKPETGIILERDGGLLITCDSVQHWVPNNLMSFGAKIITRLLGFQKSAQIGPAWKKAQTAPNSSLLEDFNRLAAFSFERIIGGHGGLLESNGQALLKATIRRELS